MKKTVLFLFVCSLFFISCETELPPVANETIDEAILGAWKVDFSETITGVRMRPNGTLELIPGLTNDTTKFFGESGVPISSFMFGRDENIIDIRNDNQINLFRLNDRGGVTVSREQVWYFVRNDTLFRRVRDMELPHLYHIQNDTLIMRRVPVDPEWAFTISRYVRMSF